MSLPKPYYNESGITIYHGDCKEILPHLEPVDLVLTDPPYEQNKTGGGIYRRRPTYKEIGKNLSSFNPDEYWDLLSKASKNTHGYIFTSKSCLRSFITLAETSDLSWDILIYGKNNPLPMKNNRYLSSFEYIFFYRGKDCYWNNETNYKYYSKIKMVNCMPSQFGHPTEKSISVLSEMINVSTKDDHTILDPFIGSGTTLVAAKTLGRKAIGIEIEEKYCEMAVKRLRQEVLDFKEAL